MTNVVKKRITRNIAVTKSEFMSSAHALAKTYEGHYWCRMSLAMKELYAALRPAISYRFKVDQYTGDVYNEVLVVDNVYRNIGTVSAVTLEHQLGIKPRHAKREHALKNGIKHIRHEAELIKGKISRLESSLVPDDWRCPLKSLKIASLKDKLESLCNDAFKAMLYEPTPVRCDVSRYEQRRERALNFWDTLIPNEVLMSIPE